MRGSFFRQPKKAALIVGAASFFTLLAPTCFELYPIRSREREAETEHDMSQAGVDETSGALNAVDAQIKEDQQSLVQLDCALSGLNSFNQNLTQFQYKLNNTQGGPLEALNQSWNLKFAEDKSEQTESVKKAQEWESHLKYEYFFSCFWHSCTGCCYDWGPHLVTEIYDYKIITSIDNAYKNIIQGLGVGQPIDIRLDCGKYSRDLQVSKPEIYITYQSPQKESGTFKSGKVLIRFSREYGSRFTVDFTLDGKTTAMQTVVDRSMNQSDAGKQVLAGLNQFLAAALAAYNAVGAEYYIAIEKNISTELPKLLEQDASLNASLNEQVKTLIQKTAKLDSAEDQYQKGLGLWLAILTLAPLGMAGLTFAVLNSCCQRTQEEDGLLSEGRKVSYA